VNLFATVFLTALQVQILQALKPSQVILRTMPTAHHTVVVRVAFNFIAFSINIFNMQNQQSDDHTVTFTFFLAGLFSWHFCRLGQIPKR